MGNTTDDVRAVLDRNEVQDLVARYHRGVDGKDWAALHDRVFTEDAVWQWEASDESGETHDEAHGREATIAWLRKAVGAATVRHFTTGHLVELDGDRATSQSYMVVFESMSLATLACGVVDADHVRTADGWRMRRLRIVERLQGGTVAAMLLR